MFVNAGAKLQKDYSDIPTKKALKESLRDNPGNVVIYTTSELSAKESHNGARLPIGNKYQVTGPNPYTSRKWYATVEKLANGTIKVS